MTVKNFVDENTGNAFEQLYPGHRGSRLLASQRQFNESLETVIFGSSAVVHRLELWSDRVSRQDIHLDDDDVVLHQNVDDKEVLVTTAEDDERQFLRVFILKQSGLVFSIRRQAFMQLLEITRAPAHYLDVILDNNGTFSSYVTHSTDTDKMLLQDYYLLVKLPYGPHVNGSIMFQHTFQTDHSDCILSLNGASIFCDRFTELERSEIPQTGAEKPFPPADPFLVLALALEHMSLLMEDERANIDRSVCTQEGKSGVALHSFNARGRAKVTEYAIVMRNLHMLKSQLDMFEQMLLFQVELSKFLVQEYQRFKQLRGQDVERRRRKADQHWTLQNAEQRAHIQASLENHASKAQWRFEQAKVLCKRVQTQIKVIESSIASYDTLIALRLARDSRTDGVAMKAITLLTMAFLPATFVATIFSMGFFEFAPKTNAATAASSTSTEIEMVVAPQVWMYVAVTVPLTVVVLGACALWLKWNERRLNVGWGQDHGRVE